MNRVRSASEFLLRFRFLRKQYEDIFRPMIARQRAQVNAVSLVPLPEGDEAALLEAHVRTYFVDILLGALNWQLIRGCHGEPRLVPEAPVASVARGTTRFIDYLGLASNSGKPLLVVETKRPSSPLPRMRSTVTEDELGAVIAAGLKGDDLGSEWNEWLATLRDYVVSTERQAGHVPRRVVLTNGSWLVLFLDPSDAFLHADSVSAAQILVFKDRDELDRKHTHLFRALEYHSVLGEAPPLSVGELPFHVRATDVVRVMHGLRLAYSEQRRFYSSLSPLIRVAPIIMLWTQQQAWLRVERPADSNEFVIPHDYTKLPEHLQSVDASAKGLLQDVNSRLGASLIPSGLEEHFSEPEAFEGINAVVEERHWGTADTTEREYRVVTGEHTHFLRRTPTVQGCPHHSWSQSHASGVPYPDYPVVRRQTSDPRSFFKDDEDHHCSHREVYMAKTSSVSEAQLDRTGARSGDVFCEIAPFEQLLCCRACAFEEVCSKAQTFVLPCRPA